MHLLLSAADRPAYFALTFVIMLLGVPSFLFGLALLRNVISDGPIGSRNWLDRMLQSGTPLAFVAMVILLVLGPWWVVKKRIPLWVYLLAITGFAMLLGPILYWSWWHDQL